MTDPDHPIGKVPGLIGQLYELVAQLEALFPSRRFTPDGHLVGSIGEVIAAHRYGLQLLYPSLAWLQKSITALARQPGNAQARCSAMASDRCRFQNCAS